jgi:hypothetical protein
MFKLNLLLTLKKYKGDTRKISMNIKGNNPISRSRIRFGFDDNISKQQGH